MRRIVSTLLLLAVVINLPTVMMFTYKYNYNKGIKIKWLTPEDSYTTINMTTKFGFYGKRYKSVTVSKDGFLTFGTGMPRWSPMRLPLPQTYSPLIAAFWADMVYWKQDNIAINENTDPGVTAKVAEHVNRRYPGFIPKNVLLITWSDMKMWIRNMTKLPLEPTNTFQAVLTTDGERSYVIFIYDQLPKARGEASTYYAQIGFDAGNHKDSLTLPQGLRPSTMELASESNVGVPGVLVFRVDRDKISYENPCSHFGKNVTLIPNVGHTLGGYRILIKGICFHTGMTIKCRYDGRHEGTARILHQAAAYCIAPPIGRIGPVHFTLTVTDAITTNTFYGKYTLVALDRSRLVTLTNQPSWAEFSKRLLVHWSKSQISSNVVNIVYSYVTRDAQTNPPQMGSFQLARSVTNSGLWTMKRGLTYSSDVPFTLVGAITVEETESESGQPKQAIHSQLQISMWYFNLIAEMELNEDEPDPNRQSYTLTETNSLLGDIFKHECSDWYDDEVESPLNWQENAPCPCDAHAAALDMRFQEVDHKHEASVCYRTVHPGATGTQQECCYDTSSDAHTLVAFFSGGGHLSRFSSVTSPGLHLLRDELPYLMCVKYITFQHKYHSMRPTDNCIGYAMPSRAMIFGAGHVITLNNKRFTFKRIGDFWLVRHPFFKMQAHSIRSDGKETEWTGPDIAIWQSVAVQCGSSDVVRVKRRNDGTAELSVNDVVPDRFDDDVPQMYNGILIIYRNSEYYIRCKQGSRDYSVKVFMIKDENHGNNKVLAAQLQWIGEFDGVWGLFTWTDPSENSLDQLNKFYVSHVYMSMFYRNKDIVPYYTQWGRNLAFVEKKENTLSAKESAMLQAAKDIAWKDNDNYEHVKASAIAPLDCQSSLSNPCSRHEMAWGVGLHTFPHAKSSQFVQCNLWAECHVLNCPSGTTYQPDVQMCTRVDNKEIGKPLVALRYLDGIRFRRIKSRLQKELVQDILPVVLGGMKKAQNVTLSVILDIERELDDRQL